MQTAFVDLPRVCSLEGSGLGEDEMVQGENIETDDEGGR